MSGRSGVQVIAHPGAGRGAFARVWPPVQRALEALGVTCEVALTERARDAHDLGRRAAGGSARLVIAVGGDGTLHEVVGGILEGREQAPDGLVVGLVPAGRGGDFARGVAFNTEPAELAARFAAVLEGDPTASRSVDVGEVRYVPTALVAGRPSDQPDREDGTALRRFVNEAGLGMGTVIAQRTGRFPPALGSWIYTVSGIVTIIDWGHRTVALTWDDGSAEERQLDTIELVLAGFAGGGMHLAPGAELDDGLFDVVCIGPSGRAELLSFSWRLRTGDHLRSPRVSLRRTASLEVVAADGRGPIYLQADGELLGRDPFSFRLLPGALRFAG